MLAPQQSAADFERSARGRVVAAGASGGRRCAAVVGLVDAGPRRGRRARHNRAGHDAAARRADQQRRRRDRYWRGVGGGERRPEAGVAQAEVVQLQALQGELHGAASGVSRQHEADDMQQRIARSRCSGSAASASTRRASRRSSAARPVRSTPCSCANGRRCRPHRRSSRSSAARWAPPRRAASQLDRRGDARRATRRRGGGQALEAQFARLRDLTSLHARRARPPGQPQAEVAALRQQLGVAAGRGDRRHGGGPAHARDGGGHSAAAAAAVAG